MENNKVNTASNDVSFLDDDANSGFKFKDLLFLVLRNLHWFILCAVVGGVIAYYQVRKQERIYASSASLLIKTSSSGGAESFRGSAVMNAFGDGIVVSSVNNEMMMLRSQTNMENMVRKLNLNTSYSYKTKVAKRNKDLYKTSPVEIDFLELDDQKGVAFTVKPTDQNHVVIEDIAGGIPAMKVKVNDTVATPLGKLVVRPTWLYQDFINVPVTVRHLPLTACASSYRSRIGVTRDSDRNTILRLSLKDTSPLRAADALNTLMDVYNQESKVNKICAICVICVKQKNI